MTNTRSSRILPALVCVVALGLGAGGCSQIAGALFRLVVHLGKEVAKMAIAQAIERQLDNWFGARPSNQNVTVDASNSLRGTLNGTVQITVQGEGGSLAGTYQVQNPRMVRQTTSSEWALDPSVVQNAKTFLATQVSK
jgi:hypothetical protein